MTTVVMHQYGAACDSMIITDGSEAYLHPTQQKIVIPHDDYRLLIGIAGSGELMVWLNTYGDDAPKLEKAKALLSERDYMKYAQEVSDWIASAVDDDVDKGSFPLEVLLWIDGRVYECLGLNGTPVRKTGYCAVGSGAPYALGAISALQLGEFKYHTAVLESAVEIAAEWDFGTGGDVYVVVP